MTKEEIGLTGLFDINGIQIKIGDKIKSTRWDQQIPIVGIVEFYEDTLAIRYKEEFGTYDKLISITGRINEII